MHPVGLAPAKKENSSRFSLNHHKRNLRASGSVLGAQVFFGSLGRCHQMTGVRFYDQPDFAAWLKFQRVTRGQSQMNFHVDAAVHPHNDDDVTLLQRNVPVRELHCARSIPRDEP